MCGLEARGGGEGDGEAEAGAQVHMDGEEHRAGAGPGDTGIWQCPAEPLLLLAQEGRVGGAQVQAGGEALDLPKAHDHPSQPSHRCNQPLAAERWQHAVEPPLRFSNLFSFDFFNPSVKCVEWLHIISPLRASVLV